MLRSEPRKKNSRDLVKGGGGAAEAKPDEAEARREEPPPRSLLSRVAHWGPLVALGVISEIAIATVVCQLEWWPPRLGDWEGRLACLNLLVFLFWVAGVIGNLLCAAERGPGYVPVDWAPPNAADRQRLQWCSVCRACKAPRSHHCRKCQRCVKKMDHHCPWINNCVGFENQPAFVKFLAFAVVGCSHALFVLGPAVYRAVFLRWHLHFQIPPYVALSVWSLLGAIFGFGLAVGVVLSVGFLLYVQLASIARNRTGIEDYILRKAAAIRRKKKTTFAYPYAIGWRKSLGETLNWSGRPAGDGLWWTLAEGEGLTQFTLSEEQLRQKAVKRRNAVRYVAVRAFSGRVLTLGHGCRALLCTPWSDEPRLRLKPHYQVMVTRWAKAWLYGELVSDGGEPDGPLSAHADAPVPPPRGWFPEAAVRSLDEMESDDGEDDLPEPRKDK